MKTGMEDIGIYRIFQTCFEYYNMIMWKKIKKILALALGIVCTVSSTSFLSTQMINASDGAGNAVKVPAEAMIPTGTAVLTEVFPPAFTAQLSTSSAVTEKYEDDEDYEDYDGDEYDDDYYGCILEENIFIVTPAKKTIHKGKSFFLQLKLSEEYGDEYAAVEKEVIDEYVDGISYRSSRSSVASVNKKGRVKGKKKGSAVIKTTVTFADGMEATYKTKVYVTK